MTFKESGLFPASDVRKRVFFSSLTLLKEFLVRDTVACLHNKHLDLSWAVGFVSRWGISWPTDRQSAFEGLCSTELWIWAI